MKTIPPLLLAAALLAPAISVFGADPATSTTNLPITINASADWIALRPELEIPARLRPRLLRSPLDGRTGRQTWARHCSRRWPICLCRFPPAAAAVLWRQFLFQCLGSFQGPGRPHRRAPVSPGLQRLAHPPLRTRTSRLLTAQHYFESRETGPVGLFCRRADSPRHLSDHRPLSFRGVFAIATLAWRATASSD